MVYLICFDQPFKHAKHYIGFVESDLKARIERHKNGSGAKLLRAVNNAGITWKVSRVWEEDDRTFERKLKNGSHSSRHCPICNPKKNEHKKQQKAAIRQPD